MNQTYSDLEAWFRAEVMSIDPQDESAFNNGVDRFITELGESVDLLGLGEAAHGGEALAFRNRLFRRLVAQHGYTAIAIESSYPQSRVVNEYVMGRGSADYEAIQETGFSHGFGKLAGNRELVEWMRQYNATQEEASQIHFYGCDAPTDIRADSPRYLLTFVLDYLASVDASAERHRTVIETLIGDDALWDTPDAAMNPAAANGLSPNATALRIATENLIADLQTSRPAFVAARGIDAFAEAMHYAVEARQLLNYHAVLAKAAPDRQGHLLGVRAAIMTDNVAFIASRERGKVLVFAHNAHVQRSKVEWQFGDEQVHWFPVGSHLDALYGSRYAVVTSPG